MDKRHLTGPIFYAMALLVLTVAFDKQAECSCQPDPYEILHHEKSATTSVGAAKELTEEANTQYVAGNYADAIILVEKAIGKEPDNPYHFLRLGLLYEKVDDEINSDMNMSMALFIEPTDTVLKSYIGFVYLDRRDYEKALDLALTGLDTNPDHEGHLTELLILKSRCLKGMGKTEESGDVYERHLKRFPDNPDAHLALAEHTMLKNYDYMTNIIAPDSALEALEIVDNAISADLQTDRLFELKGKLLAILGRNEEAIAAYNKAVHHTPITYQPIADIYIELERYEEALSYYDKAIEILDADTNPNSINYLIGPKARVLLKLGRVDEAMELLRDRRSEMTHDDVVFVYSGVVEELKKQGRYEEADRLKEEIRRR